MANAVQSGTIVDLTGEDDDENSTTRAKAVYEEAVAKASQITSLFESNRITRPLPYQDPNKSPDKQGSSGEKNTFHASSPKQMVHSRLKTFPNLARYESNGLTKDESRDGIPRQGTIPEKYSTNYSTNVSLPHFPPATAPPKPAKSFPVFEEEEQNRRQPKQITSATLRNGASNIRTPRSAALSAKQNIAETCNELEEWITKDPNLIPQHAGVSTPRKPGRPKKDSDEWSPSSNTKNIMEQQNGLSGSTTSTPAVPAGASGDLAASNDNNLSLSKEVPTLVGNKKRKLSESSLSKDSPVKSAKLNAEPGGRQGNCLPRLAESASRSMYTKEYVTKFLGGCFPKCVYPAIKAAKEQYKDSVTEDELNGIANSIINDIVDQGVEVFCPASANCPTDQRTEIILNFVSSKFHERALGSRFEQAIRLECIPSSKSAIETNNRLLSKPPNADSGDNDKSAKSTTLHMPEKMDPKLQQRFHEASDPKASEPGLSSVSAVLVRFATLFESVVFPAIGKNRKRHKDSLSQRDLDAIDKTIVNDILERLGAKSENYQPDENEKKAIKDFVKKSFRSKVRKFNAQPSHYSDSPAENSRLDTATLSSNSPALEGTTGNHQSAMLGGLSHRRNSRSNLDAGVKKLSAAQASHQSHPAPLYQEESPPFQKLPNDSPTSSFGPDFDRGRYPALRRRRGNKYYAPTRTSTTTPTVNQGNLIPSDDHLRLRPVAGISANPTLTALASNQHSNALRASNDKDHLRLLKAYANQPTALPACQTQLTAASAAEKNRTPTIQETALELLASIEGTASREFQERLAQRGVTDAEEMPFGNRGHNFPHLTKSRDKVAINQLAQQFRRKTGLGATIAPKDPRPSFCPKPATALDPSLEHVVAVLVTDTSSQPSNDGKKYSVTPKNRTQLVVDQNIVKNVHIDSNTGKQKLVRLETKVVDPVHQSGRCISSLLRNRELGLTSRGRHVGTVNQIHQLKNEMIEPWKDWKGASGDVVAVAWSADSNVYAFGAAAHTNIEDIQYNRPCNLLLGNLSSNQIRELPDHRVDRPRPDSIPSGPNANQAVYDACDPKVYETVTSIAFSPTGDRMFTASHDSTVKIWDISDGKHQCLSTLPHDAWVTSVEISGYRQGLFATASKCVKDAVRIYYDNTCYVNFSASRAESRPGWKIYPECLRWGPNAYNSHLLLAGFQQWEQQEDLISGGGQLCLWDANAFESIKVTPSSQSVYAAAWHPTQSFFATGGAPGNNIIDKANTKTVVRTWDVRNPKRYQVEYECPALDMQDITFCPLNSNIVTAGCTDGVSYIWDWRWPDLPLHRLKHGRPLVDLDHTREREEADTGVMLSLWGPGGSLFYTGSSDGVIKAWDVRRHPKDVLISNIANYDVSIQSGAFSPDGNNLLVGDAEGGIHILSSAPCGPRANVRSVDAYIDLVRAPDGSGLKIDHQDDNPGTEGIEAAKSLIESGQLQYHKELGVGQGPNYQGPYATYARKEVAESTHGRLRRKFEKKQPISKRGEKRWDIAIRMTSLLCERKEMLELQKDCDKTVLHESSEHVPKTVQRSNVEDPLQASHALSTAEGALAVECPPCMSFVDCTASEDVKAIVSNGTEEQSVDYNTIPESEMVEENYWWVRMGEEEIDLAKAGRLRY